jgi:hypothetical protein
MSHAPNQFLGTWILNPGASAFDANHKPRAGRMQIALEAGGWIVMTADGVNEHGEPCAERPSRLMPDGQDYPLPDFAGLVVKTTCVDAHTMRSECRRQDGSIVGAGTFTVSPDGRSMTATTQGWDSQLREFKQTTHWDRQ